MAFPEESEGEVFTRALRSRFYQIDAFSEFEMARMESITRAKGRRWATTQGRLIRSINGTQNEIDRFVDRDMEQIFRAGMLSGADDNAYVLTAADKAALRRRRSRVRVTMENAKVDARRSISGSWRKNRQYAHSFPEGSRNRRGVAVIYKDGRRQPYGAYMESVLRTEAQSSYNLGVIRGAQTKDVVAFEVVDGPGCGLTSHDDGDVANGQILNADDCKRYLVAHPNCTRTFVPRPDLPDPGSRRSRVQAIRERLQSELAAAQAKDLIDFDARAILLDMALDAQFRKFVFDSARRGVQELAEIQYRIDDYLFQQSLIGNPLTEDELFDIASAQIDEFLETGEISQIDEWLRFILLSDRRVTVPGIQKAASDFDYLREIAIRADMSHRELNVLNSIEGAYGEVIIRRLGRLFPEADDLGPAYERFLQRYLPNANPGDDSKRIADRLRNRLLSKGLREVQEATTERLADVINQQGVVTNGVVSFPRLGRYVNRKDLFGARYTWTTRVLRAESTIVNKWRHLDRENLIGEILARNGSLEDVKAWLEGDRTVFQNVMRKKSRQELIKTLGYRPGLLHHFTINPQGMVRLGFRWDPAYGWKRPLPVLRVVPSGSPLRYEAKLNRGRLIKNVVGQPDGVRIRTISQEISIATGGWANANSVPGFNLPSGLNPGIDRIGIRLKTVLNQIEGQGIVPLRNADDLALLFRNLSVNDIIRQTEFMSVFAEMKAMGWSWLRIGHTMSLKPDEVQELARTFRIYFGPGYRQSIKATTYITQAQRAMATGEDPEKVLALIEKALIESRHFGEVGVRKFGLVFNTNVSPDRKMFLLRRISNDANELYRQLANYYEARGMSVIKLHDDIKDEFSVFSSGQVVMGQLDDLFDGSWWQEQFRMLPQNLREAAIKSIPTYDPLGWLEAIVRVPLDNYKFIVTAAALKTKDPFLALGTQVLRLTPDNVGSNLMGYIFQKSHIWQWNKNMPDHLKVDGLLASSPASEAVQQAGQAVAEVSGFRKVTAFGIERTFANLNYLPRRIVDGWVRTFNALEDEFPHIAASVRRLGADDHLAAGRGTSPMQGMWTMNPVQGSIKASVGELTGELDFDLRDGGTMQMWNTSPGFTRRAKQANWISTADENQAYAHEFGHVAHDFVDNWDRVKTGAKLPTGDQAVVDIQANPFRQGNRAAQIIEEAIQKFAPEGVVITDDRVGDRVRRAIIRENLSRYGSTDWKEAWAEAFAEGYLMGDDARPFAKFVYQRFLEENEEFVQALAQDPTLGGRLSWILPYA